MPPPKSQKLLREETKERKDQPSLSDGPPPKVYAPGEVILIKEVPCYNDFVAILQFRISLESNLILDEKVAYKNEGMVVGFGPGLPGLDGKRVPSQLELGDVVSFYGNPTLALQPKSGHYAGSKVVFLSERTMICKLPKVAFEIIKGGEKSDG
jgi:hypothetical protein